jgi:hypothetical protein
MRDASLTYTAALLLAVWVVLGLPVTRLNAAQSDLAALLVHGEIGAIKLGASMPGIREGLGSHIKPDFLGKGRRGLLVQSREDLLALGLGSFAGVSISAVELLFIERGGEFGLTMVSFEIPCAEVGHVRQLLKSRSATAHASAKAPQRIDQDPTSKFVWGVWSKPTCNFWFRDA